MYSRWVDPHIRTSIALAVLILSITGLVLADRGQGGTTWPTTAAVTTIATSPTSYGAVAPLTTSQTFQGQGAHGRFALSHGRVLASGRRPIFAEVQIFADESPSGMPARVPVAMVLVVDNSGSMAGQKILDARRATLAVLDEMQPDDMVAVVKFNTEANVVVPMMSVSQARRLARSEVQRMQAMGNTDIANALRTADSMVRPISEDRVRRVVLVTDGRDTSGAPRTTGSMVARNAAGRGVTISALGIGADYDDAYLASLADAGRGNYEFLASTSALERFLSRELRETRQTTIQNVVATMNLPPNAQVTDVWGANWDRTSEGARLTFGSMFTGDERRAIVSFTVDAGPVGSWFTVSGRVTWRPVGGREVRHVLAALRVESVGDPVQVDNARDFSVLASVTSVQASHRELEAARAFERGDRDTALRLNEENKVALDAAAGKATGVAADRIRAQQNAYKSNRDTYSTKPPSAAPARAIGARESANIQDAYSY